MDIVEREKRISEIEKILGDLRAQLTKLVVEERRWEDYERLWHERRAQRPDIPEEDWKSLWVSPESRQEFITKAREGQTEISSRITKLIRELRHLKNGDTHTNVEADRRADEKAKEAVAEVYKVWKFERMKPPDKRTYRLQRLCDDAVRKHFPDIRVDSGKTKFGRLILTEEFKKKRDTIRSRVNAKFRKRRRV